jgi:Family of unknown function (DUF5335)
MQTRQIPAEEWSQFVTNFSKDHLGQDVTIEVLDPEQGPQHVADNLPLMGLSFDTQGTRPSSIEIAIGDLASGLLRHVVDLPMIISIATEGNDHDVALQIQPAQGPVTLLVLRGEVH